MVLVPPDDPDALAVTLRELAKDRPMVAELGRRARARYSWQRVAAATIAVYEPLVAGQSSLWKARR